MKLNVAYDAKEALQGLKDVNKALSAVKRKAVAAATAEATRVAKSHVPVDTGALQRSIHDKADHFGNPDWRVVEVDYPDSGKPYYAYAVEYGVQGGKRGDRKAVGFMKKARQAGLKVLKNVATQGIQEAVKKVDDG